jgi:hypothetical protein
MTYNQMNHFARVCRNKSVYYTQDNGRTDSQYEQNVMHGYEYEYADDAEHNESQYEYECEYI